MFAVTVTLSGFVNGENATSANVTGSATGSSTALANTGVGSATIIAGGGTLSAANYDFPTLVNGTLTINKAHLTVTADDKTRPFGQANPAFTETLSGFVNGENATSANVTGSASGSSTANAATAVGTAAITASTGTLSAANYDFPTLVNGNLTINPAAPAPVPTTVDTSAMDPAATRATDQAQKPPVTSTTTALLDRNANTAGGQIGGLNSQGDNSNLLPVNGGSTAKQAEFAAVAKTVVTAMAAWKYFGRDQTTLSESEKTELANAAAASSKAAEYAKQYGESLEQIVQAANDKDLADKANEQARQANENLAKAQADALTAQKNVTASESKLKGAVDALAADPDSQEKKLAVMTAKLHVVMEQSEYGKRMLAAADAEADATQKAADAKIAQLQARVTEETATVAIAEREKTQLSEQVAAALAVADKEKAANELLKSAQDESASKAKEAEQINSDVEAAKAAVADAAANLNATTAKVPVSNFLAALGNNQSAKSKDDAAKAAARADPNGDYIQNYAKRAAIIDQLASVQSLLRDMLYEKESSTFKQGANDDEARQLFDQITKALQNERSTGLIDLQNVLDDVKANASRSLASPAEHGLYNSTADSPDHRAMRFYLDASFFLEQGLQGTALSRVASNAASEAAKNSAQLAATLAQEAKQAADKAGADSELAVTLTAQARAAANSAAADMAEANARDATAKKELAAAEAKAKKAAEDYAAFKAAEQKAYEEKVAAAEAAKQAELTAAAARQLLAAKTAESNGAKLAANKTEAELKAEDKKSKENALEGAKREAAFYAKGTEKAASDAAEARATAEQAKTSLANFEADITKWKNTAAEKEALIPLTAKTATDDAAAAKSAAAKSAATKAALDKAKPGMDAANQAQLKAARELASAESALEALDFDLHGADLLELVISAANEIIKATQKADAEAKVANAQAEFDRLEKIADDEIAAYNGLVDEFNANDIARVDAENKANRSATAAEQAKLDKQNADENVVISTKNAAMTADYAKEAGTYAADSEAGLAPLKSELAVRNDRVKKAEEVLAALDK